MHGGHDGDAEVDEPALVADAEATILRDAALGDVELAHDLHARQDGLVVLAGNRRHGLLQDAVDAVLDEQAVVAGLEVDVGGAALKRGEDSGVDKPDDRRNVAFAREPLDRDVLVGVVVAGEHVEGEALAGLFEDALALLGLFQQVGDLREGGYSDYEPLTEQAGDLVEHHQLRGIAYGN